MKAFSQLWLGHSKPFEKILSASFLLVVVAVILPFALKPLVSEIQISSNWRAVFAPYQDIGGNCRVSFNPPTHEEPGLPLLERGRLGAKPFRIPFRSEPSYVAVPQGHWVYVGCDVVTENIEKYISPVLFVGPVWGKTKVFINDLEVRSSLKYSQIKLPLTPETIAKPFKFEMVSLYDVRFAGPASLMPVVLLPSENDLRRIERTLNYSNTEQNLVPLGIIGTMMALFLCCWIFGVRYRDVYWMIITCAAAAGSAGMLHNPDSPPSETIETLRYVVEVVCWCALWISIYTFLRKPAKQTYLVLFVIGSVCLYMLQFLLPQDLYKAWLGGPQRYDGIWQGVALLVLSAMCFRIEVNIPRRRYLQRRILGAVLLLFGLWVLWAGFYSFRIGFSFSSLTRSALIGTFGVFMIVDLVIFQRAYFEEKSLKEEEERRRLALEDRMELGFSIQRLLMPPSTSVSYGPFQVNVYYECADLMAGDWFYWRETNDVLKITCGDVVGKGPQAAIAATSILTLCHNLYEANRSIELFLKRLNLEIATLFQSKPISTIGGAGLYQDGSVEVVNHGFAGWIHSSKDGVELLNQRGASLGASVETQWAAKKINMNKGDRLIIFSDGIAEGPRMIKKICRELSLAKNKTFGDILQMVLEVGRSSVIEDDRTLLMIERVS